VDGTGRRGNRSRADVAGSETVRETGAIAYCMCHETRRNEIQRETGTGKNRNRLRRCGEKKPVRSRVEHPAPGPAQVNTNQGKGAGVGVGRLM